MKDEVYKKITEIWNFTKKYLAVAEAKDHGGWEDYADDARKIYNSTEGMPEYFREMTFKMTQGAMDLVEGVYRA
jgi:ribosomal protein S24E